MKYYELDQDEQDILKDFDQGNYHSLGKRSINKYRQYAVAAMNKTRNINIRLAEKDLQKVKVKAMTQGIPYQTLVSSIIHQYANDSMMAPA